MCGRKLYQNLHHPGLHPGWPHNVFISFVVNTITVCVFALMFTGLFFFLRVMFLFTPVSSFLPIKVSPVGTHNGTQAHANAKSVMRKDEVNVRRETILPSKHADGADKQKPHNQSKPHVPSSNAGPETSRVCTRYKWRSSFLYAMRYVLMGPSTVHGAGF